MKKFVALAYEALGLDPEGHDIGTMRFIDLPPEVFYTICAHRLEHVLWDLYEHWEEEELEEWDATAAANGFMLFKDWQHMVKNRRSYTFGNERDPEYQKRFDAIVEWRALRLYNTHRYDHNFDGWKTYLCDASPHFAEHLLFKEFPIRLPYEKFIHAYIVAGSRSGKTSLLTLLAHSAMKRRDCAVVFIDPAGEVSQQIARWQEFANSDRLVYVDPALHIGMTPTINPLQISGIRASDWSLEARQVKRVVALQVVEALHEVISRGEGSEISGNMDMVLTHCVLALLDLEGATLRDLKRLMDDDPDLIRHGTSLAHYPTTTEFFQREFLHRDLAHTKNAIRRKLYKLFLTGIFEDLTCATERTIDFEQMLEDRKIIVFNLAKGTAAGEGIAFGRLVTAMLLQIVFRRSRPGSTKKPIPIMYLMDECQNFVTKSVADIVNEAAKFQLFITMAQLQIGQGMSNDLRDAVLNASVQIGGVNKSALRPGVAKMLGVEPDDIAALERGGFIINMTGLRPFAFRTHKHLLDWNNSISDSEWEAVKADQLRRYYRLVEAPAPAPAAPLPEHRPPLALAPRRGSNRPPSNRRPVPAPITEDDNIF